MMPYLTNEKKMNDTVPAITGDMTQERNSLLATSHSTDENPFAAMEKPMIQLEYGIGGEKKGCPWRERK
jgi:hypothetical protein